MARMIPELTREQIIAEHESEAEARVYAALEDQLDDDVTVLYSVPWIDTSSRRTRDGEADFVILDPMRGIQILEVKGGMIEISSGGRWSTRGGKGEIVPMTSPFVQGVNSKHVLEKQIKAIPGVDVSNINFAHGVALPDVLMSPGYLGLDSPKEILILGSELDSIGIRIAEISDFWSGHISASLDIDQLNLIIDQIFPQKIVVPPLGVRVRSAEEQVVTLTRQQTKYLGFLGDRRRVCIEGSAGTGKTVLAFEKAKQLAGDGVRTLLTCFNNRLARVLSEQAREIPNLSVWTFHDTCTRMAIKAGFDLPEDKDRDSEFFDVTLLDLMIRSIDRLPDDRFGAVIVDEAQDFEPDWWDLLELLLNDDEEPWFWAFRDSSQNLWEREAFLPEGMEVFPLTENVRNSSKIFEAVSKFAHEDKSTPAGPIGGEVRYELAKTKSAVKTVVGRVLHQLINEGGLSHEDVAVLTASSVGNSALAGIERAGAFTLDRGGEQGSGIELESVYRFKGLEKPAIIVTDLKPDSPDVLRYVAMTRARNVLILVGDEEVLEASGWQK